MTETDFKLSTLYVVALVVLSGLTGVGLGPGVAAAANTVGDCSTITASGSYELDGDLEGVRSGGDACLRIEASDVHLEGNGHTLEGPRNLDTVGIFATGDGLRNVTVANLTINLYNNGTRFAGVDEGTLENITVNNQFVGVRLDSSTVTGTDVTMASGPTIDFDAANVLLYQAEPPSAPDGMAVAGQDQFSQLFVGQTGQAFADVTIHYDPAGLDESTIALWRFDPDSEAWLEASVGATVDRDANTVSAGISIFDRRYAVLGEIDTTDESTDDPEPTPTPSGVEADPALSEEQLQPADASFGESIVTVTRGNIASLPLTLTNTETATVTVGSTDVNYRSDVTVTDGDGDGRVALRVNTFATGGVDAPTFTVQDSADAVTSVDSSMGTSSPLESGEYALSVAPGADPSSAAGADETDVATVIVEARETGSLTVRSAPGSRAGTIQDAEDVARLRSAGSLAPVSTVAAGDLVVHEVDVSGLEGLVAARRPSGGDATDAFLAAMETGDLAFDVEETDESAGPNAAPASLAIDETTLNVVPDYDNGTLYLVYDLSATNTPEAGDEYRSTFTVTATSGLTANPETFDETWTVEERRIRLETNGDLDGDGTWDDILVQPSLATLTGTSTLAPGSHATIVVRSIGGNSPFTNTARVSIRPNGTFAAEIDFSDVSNGTDFTASFREGDRTYDGLVIEGAGLSVKFEDQLTDGTSVTVDLVSLPDTGRLAIYDGPTDGEPVAATTLMGGTHSNVSLTLDEPLTAPTQLVAVVRPDDSERTATDTASVRVGVSLTFEDQERTDPTVTVSDVTLPAGGIVTVENVAGRVVGSSAVSGTDPQDVSVQIDADHLPLSDLFTAVAREDANDNGAFDPDVDDAYERDGAVISDRAFLTIDTEPPTANPGSYADVSRPSAGATVHVDGTDSSDNLGIDAYDWTVSRNGNQVAEFSGATGDVSLSGPGTYTVELQVTDPVGQTDSATSIFDVLPSPSIDFTDQEVSASSEASDVTLQFARLPESGFVGFHLQNETGTLVGSTSLTAGVHSDVSVGTDVSFSAGSSADITAVLYRDVDDDGTLDLDADAPYRHANDSLVVDAAVVSAPAEDTTTTGDDGPGFTVLGTVIAILGLIGLARRRR